MISKPTTSDVDDLLALRKGLVRPLSWATTDHNKSPVEYGHYTVVNTETEEILEGVAVSSKWYPALGTTREKYSFNLIWHECRIFAIDYAPASAHKNKIGYGRPYFGLVVGGCHEHIWDQLGDGYCEPLSDTLISGGMEAIWSYFCERATIINNKGFTPPRTDENTGQMSWV
jgi:hypothetical protein